MMHRTWRITVCSWVVVGCAVATLTLALSPSGFAVAQEARPNQRERNEERSLHRERYDNPPGEPAKAPSGAQPTAPIVFGPFVHRQVNVNSSGANIPGDAANEPSIAIDPNNPNRIAIGWRQFDTVASNFREAGYAYSTDGGYTWTTGVLQNGVYRSDPVLDFDAAGNFYYNSLTSPASESGIYSCDVFKSTNGGQTWGPEVDAFGDDKEWLAVDRTGGPGHGHVYSTWQNIANGPNTFTRSVDGAPSFEPPVLIDVDHPRFGNITVGPDGSVYTCGVRISPILNTYSMAVAKSTNAKNAAATPTFTIQDVDLGGSLVGQTCCSPNQGGLKGQGWILADHSNGPPAGNVYMLASVDPPGSDPLDVHFIRSEDGGATWSSPVRINDDPVGTLAWQWFGTMSVAPNGRIDVVWNDTRNGLADNWSQLMYSFSTDGGRTWAPNIVASPLWNERVGWPGVGQNQNRKIGDYYHMISDNEGASLAWAATFNGEQDVYYTRLVPGVQVALPASDLVVGAGEYFEVSWMYSSPQGANAIILLSEDDGDSWRGMTDTFYGDGSKVVVTPWIPNTHRARIWVSVETAPGVWETGISDRFVVNNSAIFQACDTFFPDLFGAPPNDPEIGGYCDPVLLDCVPGTPDPTEFFVIPDNFSYRDGLKTLGCNAEAVPAGFSLPYDMRSLGWDDAFSIEYETRIGTVGQMGGPDAFFQYLMILDDPCLPFGSCPSYNLVSLEWGALGDLKVRRSPPPLLEPEVVDTGFDWSPSPNPDYPLLVQWHRAAPGQIRIWFGYRVPTTGDLVGQTIYDGYYPPGYAFRKFVLGANGSTTVQQFLNYFWAKDMSTPPVGIHPQVQPAALELLPASPNPFHATTTLSYRLQQPGVVDVTIYDVSGRRVRALLRDQRQGTGLQKEVWDGRNDVGEAVPTGIYSYSVRTTSGSLTGRVVLLR